MSQDYPMQGDTTRVDQGDTESIIDRSTAFDGVLRTSRNLRVEGQAKGEVHCEGTLYVDENAEITARIIAANITVAGVLNGEITCRGKLQILPSGRVSGKVATATLAIQEGAIYEGELRMSNVDEDTAAPAETAPPVQVSSTPASAVAGAALNPNRAHYQLPSRRGNRDSREPRQDGEEERGEAASPARESDRTPEGSD
jgi:cytoskeletal protein CcmA (bactofilin family)